MKVNTLVVGPLMENTYIISINNDALIIDPGDEENKISKFIKDNNLNIIGILITHYHEDHIGALEYCKKKYKVNVFDYNNIGHKEIRDFNFEIIETKGHKEDAVTFYFKKDKIMFTGDFLFNNSIGRCDLPGGNYEEMKDSLNKIKKYDKDIIIYPGHGDSSYLEKEIKYNPYL